VGGRERNVGGGMLAASTQGDVCQRGGEGGEEGGRRKGRGVKAGGTALWRAMACSSALTHRLCTNMATNINSINGIKCGKIIRNACQQQTLRHGRREDAHMRTQKVYLVGWWRLAHHHLDMGGDKKKLALTKGGYQRGGLTSMRREKQNLPARKAWRASTATEAP